MMYYLNYLVTFFATFLPVFFLTTFAFFLPVFFATFLAVFFTAFFGLSNRIASFSNMMPNPEFYLMGRAPRQK